MMMTIHSWHSHFEDREHAERRTWDRLQPLPYLNVVDDFLIFGNEGVNSDQEPVVNVAL